MKRILAILSGNNRESYKPCVTKNEEAPRKHLCFLGAEFIFRNIGRQPAYERPCRQFAHGL